MANGSGYRHSLTFAFMPIAQTIISGGKNQIDHNGLIAGQRRRDKI